MAEAKVSAMVRSWDERTGVSASMTLAAARQAAASGLDGLVVGDHVTFYGYGNDGLITLTAAATVPERIELKTCVYPLPLRHAAPMALQTAQLSGGRLVFGIGVGSEDRHEFTNCGTGRRARATSI